LSQVYLSIEDAGVLREPGELVQSLQDRLKLVMAIDGMYFGAGVPGQFLADFGRYAGVG
jgi:hypothetical protein